MELLRGREATGMSREEVARQLEWSTSTLFRIETGRNRPQPGNVRTLLELYGVTGAERDGLIQLTREARQPGWWHSFRDVLPNPYEVYIGLEAGAASIRNFEPIVVPGLLQTADYARETFRNGPIELDSDEVERLLEVRLARQEILARDERPRLWAGTVADLATRAEELGDAFLRVYVTQPARAGLREDVLEALPNALEIRIDPEFAAAASTGRTAAKPDRSPSELFGDYCAQHGVDDARVQALFDKLHDTVTSPTDTALVTGTGS
jgi:transcriptional regulator with XRE-family HTH domain